MSLKEEQLPVDKVKALLSYDPTTGELRWKERDLSLFKTEAACKMWNSRFATKPAFTALNDKGYYVGGLFYKMFYAHRVAWAIYTGRWPSMDLDHINGNRGDNRITNLREVTKLDNLLNRQTSPKNKYIGVKKSGSKYWATFTYNGANKTIGPFDKEHRAALAYDMEAYLAHGGKARLNFEWKD